MIYFMNESGEDVTYKQKMLLREAVKATLDYEGFQNDVQISVTFVDDEGIRAINNSYRNIDKATDVLSFPLTDFEGGEEPPTDEPEIALGDIVISLERARAQAAEFGHSFDREIAFLTVHSMLHLLGYDHVDSEEDDKEMRARQSAILEKIGLGVK
ncbi:MAG: rRNA maturation RNase YbeY [Ruminococcaceae bacterium]|nr:rRNA maturation RNase YbeY [Oscillospiraceae bacterium]